MKLKIVVFICFSQILAITNFGRFRKAEPARLARDAVWQPIYGTRDKFFVYSAFAEKRSNDVIRIIALANSFKQDKVLCRIWMLSNQNFTVLATVHTMKDHHDLRFSGTFILCHLNMTGVRAEETVGSSVSVVSTLVPTRPYTNKLIILDIEPDPSTMDDIHICVKPLHSDFHRVNWLIEWLEFNLLLGAKQIHLYRESVDSEVDCLLKQYEKHGHITYLPWNLPVHASKIWKYGQSATFNDCLYRSMSKCGWLLILDIDELVLPKVHDNYIDLFQHIQEGLLKSDSTKTLGDIMFKNVFFYLRWQDNQNVQLNLITARKTRRSLFAYPIKTRSKYVVRPYNAIELGNHFSWHLLPDVVSTAASTGKAVLHHYRETCVDGHTSCLYSPSATDLTAHRWASRLYNRVQQKISADTCIKHSTPFPSTALQVTVIRKKKALVKWINQGCSSISDTLNNMYFLR